jgi:Asp-tRNA(Asn)/Glu-tRNA(Gln) amidotransferase A subunit family amidase
MGIFGLKPSPQRTTYKGIIVPVKDGTCPQSMILATAGPLCHSVEDIITFCKALWTPRQFELDN